MAEVLREQIATDLTAIFKETMGDWEYSGEIHLRHGFLRI